MIFFLFSLFNFTQGGSRPHVIFAKNEVRITVFDDGRDDKDLPTGFAAEVEGIRTSIYALLFYVKYGFVRAPPSVADLAHLWYVC